MTQTRKAGDLAVKVEGKWLSAQADTINGWFSETCPTSCRRLSGVLPDYKTTADHLTTSYCPSSFKSGFSCKIPQPVTSGMNALSWAAVWVSFCIYLIVKLIIWRVLSLPLSLTQDGLCLRNLSFCLWQRMFILVFLSGNLVTSKKNDPWWGFFTPVKLVMFSLLRIVWNDGSGWLPSAVNVWRRAGEFSQVLVWKPWETWALAEPT